MYGQHTSDMTEALTGGLAKGGSGRETEAEPRLLWQSHQLVVGQRGNRRDNGNGTTT